MTQNVVVSTLINKVRLLSDMVNTQFVTDAEIILYLNSVYKDLYHFLASTYQDYFRSSTNIPLVPGTNEYALPAAHWKTMGVDLITGGQNYTLKPWNFNERNRLKFSFNGKPIYYIVTGNNILFRPDVAVNDTVTVYYVPVATDITSSSQSVDFINGLDDLVAIKAAIYCKQKEESDVTILMSMYEDKYKIFIDTFSTRDDGFPKRMTDVTAVNDRYWNFFYGV